MELKSIDIKDSNSMKNYKNTLLNSKMFRERQIEKIKRSFYLKLDTINNNDNLYHQKNLMHFNHEYDNYSDNKTKLDHNDLKKVYNNLNNIYKLYK